MKTSKIIFLFLVIMVYSYITDINKNIGEAVEQTYVLNRLHNIFFMPQTNYIISDCSSEPRGSIRIWSLDKGKSEIITQLKEHEYAGSFSISKDGDLIAVVTKAIEAPQEIGCYSIEEKKWLWKNKWVEGLYCDKVSFTPDGNKIIAVGAKKVIFYEARTGKILKKMTDPFDGYPILYYSPRNLSLSASRRYIVIWQETLAHEHDWWRMKGSKKITVWDLEKDKRIAQWKKNSRICSATFSSDENDVILGSMDGYIRIYSIAEQKMVKEWKAHWKSKYPNADTLYINYLTISYDKNLLASSGSGDEGHHVKIWNYKTGELVKEFRNTAFNPIACGVNPMVFSQDGKYFALEQNGKLCLYDTKTWENKWCVYSCPEEKGKN